MVINCREVNELLVTGNVGEELTRFVELLELENPNLPMLSPLARAAWHLLSRGSISSEEAEAALVSTVLIAGEDSEGLLSGESICTFELEKAAHLIPVKVMSQDGSRMIRLSFESEGNFQCMLGSDAPLTPWLTLDCLANAWHSSPREPNSPFDQFLFPLYETVAVHKSPVCYPCDTDFIGMITYTLVDIEGNRVGGPSLLDQKNSLEWPDYGLLEKKPSGREFCWLHQLTLAQAHSLGLARSSGTHQDPDMPEWLADNLTFSKLWIGPDDLHDSYSEGRVIGYGVDSLLLCLGAGQEWSPGDLDSQMDELDSIEEYPSTQLPIKVFSLSKGLACDDPDLGQALQILDQLVQIKNASA